MIAKTVEDAQKGLIKLFVFAFLRGYGKLLQGRFFEYVMRGLVRVPFALYNSF